MKQLLSNDLKFVLYGVLLALVIFAACMAAPVLLQNATLLIAAIVTLGLMVIPTALQLWQTSKRL
jgi:hypothetical protein